MTEMISISKEDLDHLQERAGKLAQEKSYLELAIRMMNKINAAPGLENTIESLLKQTMDVVGGTNLILYYLVNNDLFYHDVYGKKMKVDRIDDPLVQQAFETGEPIEYAHEFADTKMAAPEFSGGYTWAYPLMVGPVLIGVFKLENLILSTLELMRELPTFFNYAALVLKNEIQSASRLKQAYDQLSAANSELTKSKEELEMRVAQRTAELSDANERLQEELAERKRTEQRLALLNFALGNVHEAAFLIDENACFHYINEESCRFLGYTTDELLGMSVSDLDSNFPLERWPDHWNDLKTQRSMTFESHHKTKDGRIFPVEVNANYFEYDGQSYILALVRDITERKRAETALRESEAKYIDLYENAPDMYVSVNAETALVENCNLTTANTLGYSKEEIIGRPIFELYQPDRLEEVRETFKQFVEKGEIRDKELQLRRKDGTGLDVSLSVSSVRDAEGRIVYSRSTWREITERKKAEDLLRQSEQELRESEERLKEAQRIAHLGHWELDLQKNVLRWSDEVYRLFGLEPQEFAATYEAFLERVHPDDRDFVDNAYTESVRNKTGYDIEHRILLKNGETIYVNERCTTEYDTEGNPLRSLGTVLDITERKRAEEALSESERRYRIVADNTYDWEFWLSPTCEYVYTSPSCKRITGYEAHEFRADPDLMERIVHKDDRSRHADHVQDHIKEMRPGELEYRIVRSDGTIRWIEHLCQPVFDERGNFLGTRGSNRDITDRKRAEETLSKANRTLTMFSNVNQALIHATDEPALLDEVCRIAVEIGGYRQAWIGYAENDPERTIRLVASDSKKRELFRAMQITWKDVDVGRGPTGTAIRTGKPVTVSDVSTDPRFAPWRSEALERGYASCIAIPLSSEDEIFGALTLYGSLPNEFEEEEVRLLTELAGDLSYGITSLRARARRRRAEESLKKANRTLATLSNVNQALIHATDEPALLDEVCRIAVETGGYRMAWIGYAENDPEKTVRPVAFAGYERGLFKEIQVSWADVELGRGPTGRAIRNGQPIFVSDIASDPSFEPWRRQAEERGYASCISVPLSNEEGVFGALILYGSLPDEFEEEEIRLLVELAGDLSYGITSLRTEEKRRQAEKAFWESSQMLKQVLSTMPAFLFWKDCNSVYLGCNDLFAATVGLASPEDILGKTDLDLPWRSDEAERYRAEDRQVMGTGVPKLNYEEIAHTAEGRAIWVLASKVPLRNADGDIIGVLGTFEDITERKEAEEALRYSEEKYRKLYESMMDGFALSDLEGRILEFNKPYAQMLGYSDEELLNLTYTDVTPLQWREHEQQIVEQEVLQRGYSETFEKEYRRQDGAIIPVELRKYLLRDDEGNPIGMWSVVRDISDRKRVEEEKRQFYHDAIRSVTDGKLEIDDRDAVSPYQAVSDFTQVFKTASELSSTRRLVETYCSAKGLQDDPLGMFLASVGEAMTNALKHANGGEVFCGSSREELWVGIADTGPGISTLTIPSAMLRRGYSTKASLGMGFSIMLDASDRVLLSTGPEGTTVILFKRLGEEIPRISLADLADTWDTIRPM